MVCILLSNLLQAPGGSAVPCYLKGCCSWELQEAAAERERDCTALGTTGDIGWPGPCPLCNAHGDLLVGERKSHC